MGYLSNSSITVDAILTRRGRELLARGKNEFNITHFALADDEIDYSLWNTDHPQGSAFYGVVIENMPITEAVPDETQTMKYKLVTLPKKTQRIPVINVPQTTITLNPGESFVVTPATINYIEGNSTYGYTFILADSDVCTMRVNQAARAQYAGDPNMFPQAISQNEEAQPVTVSGMSVSIQASLQTISNKTTTLTIIGNETGGRTSVTITVKKQTINTVPGMSLTA